LFWLSAARLVPSLISSLFDQWLGAVKIRAFERHAFGLQLCPIKPKSHMSQTNFLNLDPLTVHLPSETIARSPACPLSSTHYGNSCVEAQHILSSPPCTISTYDAQHVISDLTARARMITRIVRKTQSVLRIRSVPLSSMRSGSSCMHGAQHVPSYPPCVVSTYDARSSACDT
jgi:hypothetical protein